MIVRVSEFMNLDSNLLFSELKENIQKGKKLILDFHAIKALSYDFLEDSLGKLFEENCFDDIEYQLNFKNVDVGIREMLSRIVSEKYK